MIHVPINAAYGLCVLALLNWITHSAVIHLLVGILQGGLLRYIYATSLHASGVIIKQLLLPTPMGVYRSSKVTSGAECLSLFFRRHMVIFVEKLSSLVFRLLITVHRVVRHPLGHAFELAARTPCSTDCYISLQL